MRPSTVLPCVIACALLLAAAASNDAKRIQEAQNMRAGGDLAGAVTVLRQITDKQPGNTRALALLGDTLMDLGDAQQAHAAYTACLSLRADDLSCMDGMSMLYLRTGNPAAAVPLLEAIAQVAGGGALINLGIAYKNLRRYDDALRTYAKALERDAGDWKALYNSGNCYHEMGQWAHGVDMYKRALKIRPHHPDATNNMANALRGMGMNRKAQQLLEKAIKRHPGNAPLLVNLASNLEHFPAAAGSSQDAEPSSSSSSSSSSSITDRALLLFEQAIQAEPRLMEAYTNRASVYTTRKEYDLALADLQRAVELSPGSARVYTGIGNALLSLKRDEDAVSAFNQAIALDPNENGALGALAGRAVKNGLLQDAEGYYRRAIAADGGVAAWHINLAVMLNDQKRHDEARVLLQRAVQLAPQDSIAYNNYGSVLNALGLLDDALREYNVALKLQPSSALVYFNLGNVYLEKGYMENAQLLLTSMQMYVHVISIDPLYRGAFNNLGNALKEADFFDHAVRAWLAALRVLPTDADVFANLMHLRMHLCDWTNRAARFFALRKMIERQRAQGNKTISVQPFHALLYPLDPVTMLAVARAAAAEVEKSVAHTLPLQAPTMDLQLPLRIGYISHDMGDHPTGHLWQGLPSLHSARLSVKFYALNAGEDTPYWRRLQKSKWPLVFFTGVSYRDAAAAINKDRIRVLIDMDVWMKGRRPEILALRPAATQVTFLGYCGSSGAQWIDGAVVDRIVMPPEHAHIFSERLLLMPRTYQVNDYPGFYRRDVPADFHVSRAAHVLPPGSTVLANFNQLYKIDPDTLSLWASVLHRCASCVLWLLAFPYHAKDNMLKELRARNVSMSQVVMGDRIDKQKHLGRIGAADLFLDNLWVNAHTTATETLWAGVPVLTTPNIPLASRVASSLLQAAQLPELIARNSADYLHLAHALSSRPRTILSLQRKLRASRNSLPLFNSRAYADEFERVLFLFAEAQAAGGGGGRGKGLHVMVTDAKVRGESEEDARRG